jgi:hypothetical protein
VSLDVVRTSWARWAAESALWVGGGEGKTVVMFAAAAVAVAGIGTGGRTLRQREMVGGKG